MGDNLLGRPFFVGDYLLGRPLLFFVGDYLLGRPLLSFVGAGFQLWEDLCAAAIEV